MSAKHLMPAAVELALDEGKRVSRRRLITATRYCAMFAEMNAITDPWLADKYAKLAFRFSAVAAGEKA